MALLLLPTYIEKCYYNLSKKNNTFKKVNILNIKTFNYL